MNYDPLLLALMFKTYDAILYADLLDPIYFWYA